MTRASGSDLLVLRAEDRRFAIPTALVREVLRAVWIEPLPGAPPAVEGLIDYRGTPIPVFDVRVRLGLPLRPLHPHDHLVVVRAGAREVALRVDRAEALVEAPEAAIRALDGTLAASELFGGVAQLEDRMLLVHDPERFLTAKEAQALERAQEGRR